MPYTCRYIPGKNLYLSSIPWYHEAKEIREMMSLRFTTLLASFMMMLFPAVPVMERDAGARNPIEEIQSLYRKARSLDCGPGCEQFAHEVRMNTMRAAIGLQTTTVRYIYSSEQANPERDPYELRYRLHLVTMVYNIAGRMNFRTEYLFDSAENLVFHYSVEPAFDGPAFERRLYFQNGRLIQAVVAGAPAGAAGYTATRNFAAKDLSAARAALDGAVKHRRAFRAIIAAEQAR